MKCTKRLAALLLCAAFGCAEDPGSDNTPPAGELSAEDVAEIGAGLFVATPKLWQGGRIRVCWIDPGYDMEKYWVRSAIYHTWEAASSVRFLGWGQCTSQDLQPGRAVRLKFTDVYGASLLGTDAASGSVYTYLPRYPTGWCELFTPWEDCVRTSAVHEFGHVLGFEHEHMRPDAPYCPEQRPEEVVDPYADWLEGPHDQESIMNYCRQHDKWRPLLSYWDVRGVRAAYGRDGWGTHPALFDAGFYVRIHSDLWDAFGDNAEEASIHWLTHGLPREARRAHPAFDMRYYLSRYPQLAEAYGTRYPEVANHWLNIGLPNEGRAGALEFDVSYYKSFWADIGQVFATDNVGALLHWADRGLPLEARRGSASFDVAYYWNAHWDLQQAFGQDYEATLRHWIRHGRGEGRTGVP